MILTVIAVVAVKTFTALNEIKPSSVDNYIQEKIELITEYAE